MNCGSCDAVYINGVLCHESGCPDAWKDQVRECKFCGCDFIPEEPMQECCDENCTEAFYG